MTPAPQNLELTRGITFAAIVITITNKISGNPIDLTSYLAFAEVRSTHTSTLIINLNPSVTNGPTGEITIPEIADSTTITYPTGNYKWDLLLEKPTGERLGPFLAGTFVINETITNG